jgi:hypothetical protein
VDWVLLDDAASLLRALATVTGIEGLSRKAAPDGSALARRVRLTILLRRLARDRGGVRLRLADGGELTGTIDRVGSITWTLRCTSWTNPAGRG